MTPKVSLKTEHGSQPSEPAANETAMAVDREDSRQCLIGNNKGELKIKVEGLDRLDQQQLATSKPSENTQLILSSHASTHAMTRCQQHKGSPAHSPRTPSENMASDERADGFHLQSPRDMDNGLSDTTKPNIANLNVTPSSQIAELRNHYDAQLKEYESKLEVKTRGLKEKDFLISTLRAEVSTLRRDLRSCQSQLDNVQRFISTADTHADVDIIQKLQELNEEVYNISMTMADRMAEGFTRQTGERTLFGNDVLVTIGRVLLDYFATLGVDADVALFLQIAFQAFLSHVLCHIVSSWTSDQNFNALIEETYQRLRSAETQAISGHWRCLTRAHILPTFVRDPKFVVEHIIAGLSDIVVAAGCFSSRRDAVPNCLSGFREDILSIVLQAGRFGGMVSGMVSGDFSVFAVPSGATFDGESMAEDHSPPRKKREIQTVLCVSRMGLKKQIGERTILLAKAQVVLKSLLGTFGPCLSK